MDITKYYEIIKEKITNGDYKLGGTYEGDVSKLSPHLESIHYLLYEFMKDRKDDRMKKVFSYICKPNGVDEGEIDIDFTKWDTEVFLKEIMKIKK